MLALVIYGTTCAPFISAQQSRTAITLQRATQTNAARVNHPPDTPASTVPAAAADLVQVIPQPRQLETTSAPFRFERETRLTLADPRSADDIFAAQDFIDDARETGGVALSIGGRRGRRSILIGLTDDPKLRAAMERAGLSVPSNLGDEGYVLGASANEIVVAGRTAAGVFYGMQTLKQLVRGAGAAAYVPGVRIVDWPQMRWRGVTDDISRGPVPTVAYVKRQLHTFASFKLNLHSLYMEHTFKSSAHPLIGPEGAALTPAEIRELSAYARRLHIELVPEQQTFGHLHKALKLEKYNELAETPYGDVLSPQQAGSYKLIADWYREIAPLFPGQFFHIGSDETFELGAGQSREEVKTRGVGAVYFEHLRRVRETLKPYHRRLMFWGDIALNHPELIGSIPREMIVMNWHYDPRESYLKVIQPFKDAGLDQFVCPGLSNWTQIFPNNDAASVNIANFVRDGQQTGALGMLNTQWDDDGETLFETCWYGVVLGAAASWQDLNNAAGVGGVAGAGQGAPPLDITRQAAAPNVAGRDMRPFIAGFDRKFDWAFFRHEGGELVKVIRQLGGVNTGMTIGSSSEAFWREPFTASYQEGRARALHQQTRQMRLVVEEAQETILRERAGVRRNAQMLEAMRFAARRFDHMGRRLQVIEQFSRDYWNAYLNLGDRRKVMRLRRYASPIYNSFRELAEELTELRAEYRAEWLKENHPYWLDSVLARYDLAVSMWLTRSRALGELLRDYPESSTLPDPSEFGAGSRPLENNETERK